MHISWISNASKKVFCKKISKIFMPAGIAAAMTSWISFSFSLSLFFYSGPYTEFIYLEIVGSCRCRARPIVHIKQIQLFLVTSWLFFFFCFLGASPLSLVALRVGPMVLFIIYSIALNMMKNMRELQEITLYCGAPFAEETNCSRGDNQHHRAV